jgi:hypothetical protein
MEPIEHEENERRAVRLLSLGESAEATGESTEWDGHHMLGLANHRKQGNDVWAIWLIREVRFVLLKRTVVVTIT